MLAQTLPACNFAQLSPKTFGTTILNQRVQWVNEANPNVRRINFDATERVGDSTTRLPTLFRPNWPHDAPSELDTTPEGRDSFPCRRRHCLRATVFVCAFVLSYAETHQCFPLIPSTSRPRNFRGPNIDITHGWNDTMCNVVDLSELCNAVLEHTSSCGLMDRIASNLRSGWYASSSLCCQAGIEPQGVSRETGSTLPSCCSGLSPATGRCCYLRHALAALLDLGFDLYPATDSHKAWDNGGIMPETGANGG
ncbi:hypothetical protein C8F04DRAFT_1238630 [Mycena alexandri]|uniref:Uncharacterized protein n=1 Tax=Mycena alexandri TaxID=1745969 RepID=A0AAD6WTD7_9AGAR|nr:hypothetical protein C8F04DRAFT_1238630 [Mycena alexandri]